MTLGWDIGGVNTKVALVDGGGVRAACSRPYELQRDPGALVTVLRQLAGETGASGSAVRCAVTMTAELSQFFRTKRAGVAFVLDAIETAWPLAESRVFAVDGRFLTPADARRQPLLVAAANWSATPRIVAQRHPNALLVDVGTTSTDIIPIVDGAVRATGWTDPDRLASGELVYSGALRTPVEAIVTHVPYGPESAGVSAEGFALIGDVHLWRGDLCAADYTTATPDGRPVTREFAGERLARVICADRDMLDEQGISRIADAIAAAQLTAIAAAIRRVAARHPAAGTAVVAGSGAFIALRAAQAAGMDAVLLADQLGDGAARCAPAAAVALLFEQAFAVA